MKIVSSVLVITLVITLAFLAASQPSVSAYRIRVGNQPKKIDVQLSPPERIFDPTEDGFVYPGCPRITKNLEVVNVGDVPFRICRINASFTDDVHLASGLQIEILELERGRTAKPRLLYNGTLASLGEGMDVTGKRAVPKGKSVTLQVSVWMPKTAGNEYQGLTTTADIAVTVHFPPRYGGGSI